MKKVYILYKIKGHNSTRKVFIIFKYKIVIILLYRKYIENIENIIKFLYSSLEEYYRCYLIYFVACIFLKILL